MQTEDIRLEPELYEACKSDIKNYCQNVPYGNAQVMDRPNNLLFNFCTSASETFLFLDHFCLSLQV